MCQLSLLVAVVCILVVHCNAAKRYKPILGSFTFDEAKAACTKDGGKMAAPASECDQRLMDSLGLDVTIAYYLGYDDRVTPFKFFNQDNVAMNYT